MLCNGFTIPNFNPKKDNFFVMLHFTDGSIFFSEKEFCKQFHIHLPSQRSKTTGICNKDPN